MELIDISVPASVRKVGNQKEIVITANQKLRISAPQGTDILDLTCPQGKTWNIALMVEINET